MDKKLLKSIVCVVSGVAIATSIPFTATSCGNNDCIEFKSPKEFANYNFNSWQDKLGIDCHKDYTYGGKYTSSKDFEYTKNITTDLRKQESYLKYFLCQSFLGGLENVYLNALTGESDLRKYSRSDIDNLLLNPSVKIDNFLMKVTYPKNIKWSEAKDEYGDLYDVVRFSSFSFCLVFNDFKFEGSFINDVPIFFCDFQGSASFWSENSLEFNIGSFDASTMMTYNDAGTQQQFDHLETLTLYTSKSDQIFNLSNGDSKFAK